jgi:hypothetical protein
MHSFSFKQSEGVMDIVERLRNFSAKDCCSQRTEAADEIERLRKANSIEPELHKKLIKENYEKDIELERLREALKKLSCNCASNCDWESDDICPSWIARAALKGDE